MPDWTWIWPSLADPIVLTLAEADARRLGLWDDATGTVRAPAPTDWLRCYCQRREHPAGLYWTDGLTPAYPLPVACTGCLATMERQGDLVLSDAMAALGAPALYVAHQRSKEQTRRPGQLPRTRRRWDP